MTSGTVDDGLPDPRRYIVPKGFMELHSALDEALKARFGPEWSLFMNTPELQAEAARPPVKMFRHIRSAKDRKPSENELSLFRGARQRRWEVARKCVVRAFRRSALDTFMLIDEKPQPLDPRYWDGWVQSWRPFAEDPRRNPERPVYLVRRVQLTKLIKGSGPSAHTRFASDTRIRQFAEKAYLEDIARKKIPHLTGKDGLQARAASDNVHVQRNKLRSEMTRLDRIHGITRGRGRPKKSG